MKPATPRALIAMVSIALLAGCTQHQPGNPSPTSEEASMSSQTTPSQNADESTLPAHAAPKVDDPLDVASFKANPCQALTESQTKQLLGKNAEIVPRTDDAEGPSCSYRSGQTHAGVKVSFFTIYRNGLTTFYQQKKRFVLFEELDSVSGYPVLALGEEDERSKGACDIAVGVSDRQMFGLAIHLSEHNVAKKDPCEVGHTVAGMVIENIKGAQ